MFWFALIACGLLVIAGMALVRVQAAPDRHGQIVAGAAAVITGVPGLVMLAAALLIGVFGWN
jgi:hypothetical protein